MLCRKNKIGKRQTYRRAAYSVKSALEEISVLSTECEIQNDTSGSITNESGLNEIYLPTNDPNVAYSSDVNTNITNAFDCRSFQTLNEFNFFETTNILQSSNLIENNSDELPSTELGMSSNHYLKEFLSQWSLKYNISQIALTKLLHGLKPLHPELPLDARTLLHTPMSVLEKKLENGEYCHIGLRSQVIKLVLNAKSRCMINLSFNIDGVPLFSSTNTQIWPISCLIKDFKCKPFIVGIFCGNSKPNPLDQYLNDFITELYDLLQNGIHLNGNFYKINLHSFICDAPARAYIKCIKSHGGYAACDKCTDYGEWFNNRVIYPNINAPKRTDESFLRQEDEDHHLGISPLLRLNIGMVSLFPIDYMHNICLGIVRKMLYIWTGLSRQNKRVRFPIRVINEITDDMMALRTCVSNDFNRKPRGLNELAHWKATEFRTFLVYLGPIVLKNKIDHAIYENFVLLHTAVIILLSKKYISYFGLDFVSNQLLKTFIHHCKQIYGKEFLIYNVHVLSHLPDDVEKYGTLDLFSAFPFENSFSKIKDLVRSSHKPLQQIVRRLHEICSLNLDSEEQSSSLLMEHTMGPLSNELNTVKQFKKMLYENSTFCINSYSAANSYFISKNSKTVQIENIVSTSEGEVMIIGKEYESYHSLYEYPFDSRLLNIYVVDKLSEISKTWHARDIASKAMIFPLKQELICLPIFHTQCE